MINAEYDFADNNKKTRKTIFLKSAGDHEDSDEEVVKGPPPPAEFKKLLEEKWTRSRLRENGGHCVPTKHCCSGRNYSDATRKAAKAKEVANLLASKQGLVKDPAANQVFADCKDMRTKIQT